MRKLAAFTLMELLIGMIISSIVISFGYLAYNLVQDQLRNYKQVKEKIVEATQLNAAFSNDLQQAEIVSSNENKLLFHYKNTVELNYEFHTDFVVRTRGELRDTFKVAAKNIQQQFLFPERNMFLQQFSFETIVLEEAEVFHFTKKYSSETLMNYNTFTKETSDASN